MHNGSISASSQGKDKGARLTIRLPCAQTDAGVKDLVQSPPPQGHRNLKPFFRVLLVEDHPDTAEQLKRLLKRAGHEVACAGSLREARELLTATPEQNGARNFDILISDLGLPDGSGHELMRDFVRGNRIPELP